MAVAARGKDAVVDRDVARGPAKRAAHLMSALFVKTVVEAFAQDTPLEGVVPTISHVLIAVYPPADRDVVEYQLVAIVYRDGIGTARPRFVLIAEAHTDVADDDVRGVADAEFLNLERYAVARSGLPGDGETGVGNVERRFKLDGARDLKDDRAWAFGRVDPFTKRPGAGIVDVGYVIDVSSAPTLGKSSVAFGAGECQDGPFGQSLWLRHERVRQAVGRGQHGQDDRKGSKHGLIFFHGTGSFSLMALPNDKHLVFQ